MDTGNGSSTRTLAFGTVIFIATLAAWLFGSLNHIDTNVLWSVVTPVIGALFIGTSLGRVANSAQQAAIQTNGGMSDKIEAAVSTALAKRDASRTWQQAQPDPHPAPTVVVNQPGETLNVTAVTPTTKP